MADKKKVKKETELVGAIGMPDYMERESIHMKLDSIKKLKLGDYVEVKICGYVSDLSSPSEHGYSPARIGLKVEERSVDVIGDEQSEGIKKLAKDEDYDEDD